MNCIYRLKPVLYTYAITKPSSLRRPKRKKERKKETPPNTNKSHKIQKPSHQRMEYSKCFIVADLDKFARGGRAQAHAWAMAFSATGAGASGVHLVGY